MPVDPYAYAMEDTDATMLHLESPDTPFHTLKIALLDSSDRGRQVTLDEIVAIAPAYLDITPRLRQTIERRSDRRWYWVDDPDFDLAGHLDERTVSGPGGLDTLCGELAARHLDRSKPLWALTLVHGLPDGRQAVVLRVHHAVADGSAAMNAFTALSSDTRGVAPLVPDRTASVHLDRAPLARRLQAVYAAARESSRRTQAFGPTENVPKTWKPRTRFAAPAGPERVCASHSVRLADLKEISLLTGVNTNAVVHAAIGQALRDEMLAHGDEPKHPLIANFGVNADRTDLRCDGNRLATARVWLHVEDDQPLSLLARTARSCKESVKLRQARGFELQLQAAEFAKVLPPLQRRFNRVLLWAPIHLLTAYVVGPTAERWFGDVKAYGFTSYAVSVSPFDPSITAYSYAGRLWLGVVTQPASMPDPGAFLLRFEAAVGTLLVAARATGRLQPPVDADLLG